MCIRDSTVIVVEHDEDTIKQADHIIDIGVKAGIHGGEVVAEGKLNKILKNRAFRACRYGKCSPI